MDAANDAVGAARKATSATTTAVLIFATMVVLPLKITSIFRRTAAGMGWATGRRPNIPRKPTLDAWTATASANSAGAPAPILLEKDAGARDGSVSRFPSHAQSCQRGGAVRSKAPFVSAVGCGIGFRGEGVRVRLAADSERPGAGGQGCVETRRGADTRPSRMQAAEPHHRQRG